MKNQKEKTYVGGLFSDEFFVVSVILFVLFYALGFFSNFFVNFFHFSSLVVILLLFVPYLPVIAYCFVVFRMYNRLSLASALGSLIIWLIVFVFFKGILELEIYYLHHGNSGEFDGIQFAYYQSVIIPLFLVTTITFIIMYLVDKHKHPDKYSVGHVKVLSNNDQ